MPSLSATNLTSGDTVHFNSKCAVTTVGNRPLETALCSLHQLVLSNGAGARRKHGCTCRQRDRSSIGSRGDGHAADLHLDTLDQCFDLSLATPVTDGGKFFRSKPRHGVIFS